ncbi:MAG: hypothetical protein V2I76_07055 [Roseobacter sp.]|jgi:hypothetical protein|nr:hypothetical protein [Roseobacter sp.]
MSARDDIGFLRAPMTGAVAGPRDATKQTVTGLPSVGTGAPALTPNDA